MLNFFFRLWKKYEWFFNPHVDDRHPIALLMKDVGLTRSHPRVKKHQKVYIEHGRLIGLFYIDLKKDLIETFLRLAVYERDEQVDGETYYALMYTFYHRTSSKDKFKVSSLAQTPYLSFDDIAKHIRQAQVISDARSMIYQIQQKSKLVEAE